MTCAYTSTNWRDALYNAVRLTDGGVVDAARYLSERRGVSMHPEALRKKLRGLPGESVDIDLALLLTEWMQSKTNGATGALDWLLTINAQEGLHVDIVPPQPEGGWPCELSAIQAKAMQIGAMTGGVLGVTAETMADGQIDQAEADRVISELRSLRTMSHRMERNVRRAVVKIGKGRA